MQENPMPLVCERKAEAAQSKEEKEIWKYA
jgi:hypothetical protein